MGLVFGDPAVNREILAVFNYNEDSAVYEDAIVQFYIEQIQNSDYMIGLKCLFYRKLKRSRYGRLCFHLLFPSWTPIYAKGFEHFFWLPDVTSVHRFTFCIFLQTQGAPFTLHYSAYEARFHLYTSIVFS